MKKAFSYTDQATKNFLYALRVIKMEQPVVGGVLIKTERDICNLLNMHQPGVSAMKDGVRTVTLDQCADLCLIFGFSLEWMIFLAGDMRVSKELASMRKIIPKKSAKKRAVNKSTSRIK